MHFIAKRFFPIHKFKIVKESRLGIQFTIKNRKFIPLKDRWECRDFKLT